MRLATGLRRTPLIVAALLLVVGVAMAFALAGAPRPRPPLVLAAASLQEAMTAAADAWAAQGHARPVLSFAGSAALARQAAAGGAADLFVSADEAWMDDLEARGLIVSGTRTDLLGNVLVLVAPSDSTLRLALSRDTRLDAALGEGRLAIAEPDAVPAGRYGKAALERLGLWNQVSDRLARAENVRAALALVERGAAPLGIVYATDARASPRVRTVAAFPAASHPPIRYPIARLVTGESEEAEPFRSFLQSGQARAIFAAHGFAAP